MSNVPRRKAFLISSLALAIGAGNAVAGGFEKATMWDAKYSALGGAAASSVNNSSAIFYNPAGLAFIESNDVSLHASPTLVQANGPANGSDYVKGERRFVPNAGFTGAYRLTDDLVLGYGIYGAGGAAAKFKDVTTGNDGFLTASLTDDYSTDIKIIEAGLALAYRINNNWSVGGTYRLTYAYADINIMSEVLGSGVSVGYNDMSGIDNFSVRLGTMYRSDDNRWGWGLNYRSEVTLKAEGDYSAKLGGINMSTPGQDATAKTSLPMQISSGIDYLLNDQWRLFGEATYTNYKKIDEIKFESDDGSVLLPALNTNWENQMNYRVATEYYGLGDWTLRAGYVYTTAVVPEEYAAPTFSTPAVAHTYTFGAGRAFMDDTLLFDVAAEYNRIKNTDVKGGGNLTDTSKATPGRYDSKAAALHASVRYLF
ncbi:hypothetical protein GZ77_19975 [Endozoicomonas montiporae]|uniref:Aromatic hydrocarbon degradation protein n=2 Tax=Endozoicomonas montiporae TaxID=1027273 RepID=A0A081N2S2_9GAMM|nr:outer membrane protein transport protein [Endozoicomonas montiporae]AMO58012.1 long-chain fatty acid transport protein [Endozoicomonas montiporae CL-33]KEQ12745.1 hypothetical protein GZ77_19975 [Endozoicomonas montiporae]